MATEGFLFQMESDPRNCWGMVSSVWEMEVKVSGVFVDLHGTMDLRGW